MDGQAYARDFAHQLVLLLDAGDDPERVLEPLREALKTRVTLADEEIDAIIDDAMDPAQRFGVTEAEIRAVAARFGSAAAEAVRSETTTDATLSDFSAQYGAAESLLLLDAMFRFSTVDGTIEEARADRLQDAASDLRVDPQLVAFLFRKHDLRHASGDFVIPLDGPEAVIGRDEGAHLRLPDPQVAARHARILRVGAGFEVQDLGSGRPTLLNGDPIRRAQFGPEDELRIGPYTLSVSNDGASLVAFGSQAFSSLSCRGLTRHIGDVVLLDDVSFTVFTGEVIAILGPSGAGKTTLLSAITGSAPADSGDVIRDGSNFHRLLAHDPSYVGVVPQEDVVHAELTVEESLFYAGRLRFPPETESDTIRGEVDRVLENLGIDHIRGNRIGDAERRGVSGGQRKRVNVGQELLTRTTRVMFLDEPTSGLDPQTAHDIMGLARQLADDGRILFIVTHDVSEDLMALVDHLLVLAPGGRVAWFGPPKEACSYFKVDSVGGIFGRLSDQGPEAWRTAYRESNSWRTWVGMREHLLGLVDKVGGDSSRKARQRRDWLGQYMTLVRRYSRVKLRDTVGTTVLLGQAPILAVAMTIAFPQPDTACMFMLALSALWFGASDAVRELIAERTIWRREARNGVGLVPYLASKLTVLGALVLVQCFLMVGINYVALDMGSFGFDFLQLGAVCSLTGMVGVCLGLWMSAMFPTSEAAIASLPVLLIPQITFGGLIVTVKKMGAIGTVFSYGMITRYSFEMAIKTGEKLSKPGRRGGGTHTEHIMAPLWDLGFRSSEVDDMGFSMGLLAAILTAFCVLFLALAAWFTARTTRGN
jgi:ABC-type multidrug transport system ATPase subunit